MTLSTREEIQDFAFTTLLESITDLMNDACLVMSADGHILLANDEASRLYGHSGKHLTGMHVSELFAPESLHLLSSDLSGDAAGGQLFHCVHLRADGTRVPVRVSWKRSFFYERDIVTATVLADRGQRDIEEERIKSAAFDAALDAIIVHDMDGNLLHFNKAAAAAADMSAEAFARLGQWGWVPPEHRSGIPAHFEHVLTEGSAFFESMGMRADGSTYSSEVHARLLELTDGAVMVSVVRDIMERKRSDAAVHAMAYHDMLTGLPNRVLFSERAEQAMADTHRHGDRLGLAFIDLDNFKPINDRVGHQGGDSVLITIASRLVKAVRAGDTVARLGGDEFVILLPRLSDVDALEGLGEKLCRVVCEPVNVNGTEVSIHASVGLALFEPDTDRLSSLLSKADMAMYAAKRSGERWSVFDEGLLHWRAPAR